ncbi:MAG: hypothetical protein K9W45_04345 [Candidatus Heimdallarchaeum aukensis]|uniref:DUF5678 domain-containing protein n=1 Tax=Candidatus Heimdallarchaeum aukensis TaxID=2876573 RepID=A0A9Y1FMB5_9ARCH|nr:MAG: hypothetical protein K9W45_04345 [Candidatus Heimdallarchaeum aukensis]
MATIKGEVPEELEKEFRKVIAEKYGLKKGNISLALKNAIEEWIAKQKRILEMKNNYNAEIIENLRGKYPEQYIVIDSNYKVVAAFKTIEDLYKSPTLSSETRIIAPKNIVKFDHTKRRQLGWYMKRKKVVS